MKYQKFFIFPIIIASLFFLSQNASAQTDSGLASLLQQIQELQSKIQYLKTLLSNAKTPQNISADSYLAVDISDGSVIFEKNSEKQHPMASITKLMNSVITTENINLNETITLNSEMLQPLGYSPSLFQGLTVSAKNLLKASLIQSTNDAAQSLTYFLNSGKFLELMNEKAKELGMNSTCYYDAHGLNPSNQSTASDLVKLLTYIYKNHPEILTITKDNDFWLPNSVGRLLKFANLNYFYSLPEFIGGKSGYLPEAKYTFASIFNINGKIYAIAILYSDSSKSDTSKIVDLLKNK